jgi:hypothetical protein
VTGVSWTPTAPARGPDPRGPGRDGRRGRPALIFSIPILVSTKVTEERWKLTLSAQISAFAERAAAHTYANFLDAVGAICASGKPLLVTR